MDGGAWWATVYGVAKSRTRLSDFTFTFIGELITMMLYPLLKLVPRKLPSQQTRVSTIYKDVWWKMNWFPLWNAQAPHSSNIISRVRTKPLFQILHSPTHSSLSSVAISFYETSLIPCSSAQVAGPTFVLHCSLDLPFHAYPLCYRHRSLFCPFHWTVCFLTAGAVCCFFIWSPVTYLAIYHL